VSAEAAADVVAEGFLVAAALVAPALRAAAATGQAMTAVILGALAVATLLLATARHLVDAAVVVATADHAETGLST